MWLRDPARLLRRNLRLQSTRRDKVRASDEQVTQLIEDLPNIRLVVPASGGAACLQTRVVHGSGHCRDNCVRDSTLAQFVQFRWRQIKVGWGVFDSLNDRALRKTCFHELDYRLVGERRGFLELQRRTAGFGWWANNSDCGASRRGGFTLICSVYSASALSGL